MELWGIPHFMENSLDSNFSIAFYDKQSGNQIFIISCIPYWLGLFINICMTLYVKGYWQVRKMDKVCSFAFLLFVSAHWWIRCRIGCIVECLALKPYWFSQSKYFIAIYKQCDLFEFNVFKYFRKEWK